MIVTKNSSDSEPLRWDIIDDLVHLREWGTTTIYPLSPGRGAAIIGAARNAWLRITAPSGGIAQELHAIVV